MEILHRFLRGKVPGSRVREFSHGEYEKQQREFVRFKGVLSRHGVAFVEEKKDLVLEILFEYWSVPEQRPVVSVSDMQQGYEIN